MLQLILLYTLSCTCPSFEADTSRFAPGCDAASTRPEHTAGLKLYRALCGVQPAAPLFQRFLPCTAGQRVSFDAGTACATWWVTGVDSAGNEADVSCAKGYTVGVPSVSVEEGQELAHQGRLYSVTGQRVRHLERSGVYFLREGGSNRILVVRR